MLKLVSSVERLYFVYSQVPECTECLHSIKCNSGQPVLSNFRTCICTYRML